MEHKPRPTAVDAVVLRKVVKTSSGIEGEILLIRRAKPPFAGEWALPGGFMEFDENAEQAVVREVEEETNTRVKPKRVIGVYSEPDRDPERQPVSIAFLCEYISGEAKGGDDAGEAGWWRISNIPKLAFDHNKIVEDSLDKV